MREADSESYHNCLQVVFVYQVHIENSTISGPVSANELVYIPIFIGKIS